MPPPHLAIHLTGGSPNQPALEGNAIFPMTDSTSLSTTALASRKRHRALPHILWLFWFGELLLSALTWITTAYFRDIRHLDTYPYSSPFFQAYSYHFDFLVFKNRFHLFHQTAFYAPLNWPFNYPAPIALIYKVFYSTGPHSLGIFLGFSDLAFTMAAGLFARALVKRGIALRSAILFTAPILLLSYPVMLQLFLANMEVMVFVVLALGLWAYATGRGYLAAACFGLAASMKLFPFVYLGLTLAKKQYKQLFFGISVLLATSIASLWILGPTIGIAYRGIQAGVTAFENIYIFQFNPMESGMDHSLFALLKLPFVVIQRPHAFHRIIVPYLVIAAVAGILAYFLRIRNLPPVNQVLSISVASVLLPPVSHDYTLLHMYAPWAMLTLFAVDSLCHTPYRRAVSVALTCFLILFTAQNYLITQDVRFAGQMKCLALLVLFFIALRYPFERQQRDTHPRELRVPRTAAIP